MALTIEEMAVFCKKKGFVYSNSEIYGGLAGFFDYGPLGVELKNNIKQEWWKSHVQERPDIVGIDSSAITNPKVWKASGHVESFEDIMLECMKCHELFRADQFLEEQLKIQADGLNAEDINKLVQQNSLKCPKCKSDFKEANSFNLMFKTFVGPVQNESSVAYLRPETAQAIFVNFRLVAEDSRLKLPFGIAQIGKAFRNEISPRNFLFRCREFEQMEVEYFIDPEKIDDCPYIKELLKEKMNIISAEMQEKSKKQKEMTLKEAIDKKIITTKWHAYWLAFEHKWFASLGVNPKKLRLRQHLEREKSHYAKDTWDLEYEFPFGWKELQGMSNRTDFDLKQHIKHSKKDLSIFDEESKKKVIPHVIEPSQGVDRAFLVFVYDAYNYDKQRGNVVLKLNPKLSPVKAAILPLVSNKKEIVDMAKKVYNELKTEFNCLYDQSGSIGRRYARNDEIGTPLCITIDFDSLKKNDVTIRSRETTKQIRVKIKDLKGILSKLIKGEIDFKKAK